MGNRSLMKKLKRYLELKKEIFKNDSFVELESSNSDHIEYQKLLGDNELIELIKKSKNFTK